MYGMNSGLLQHTDRESSTYQATSKITLGRAYPSLPLHQNPQTTSSSRRRCYPLMDSSLHTRARWGDYDEELKPFRTISPPHHPVHPQYVSLIQSIRQVRLFKQSRPEERFIHHSPPQQIGRPSFMIHLQNEARNGAVGLRYV